MSACTVSVTPAGPTVTFRVGGHLGGAAGLQLLRAAEFGATAGHERIEIDLGDVTSYDEEGAAALAGCRALTGRLPGGVGFSVRGPAGRGVLLQALAAPVEDVLPAAG